MKSSCSQSFAALWSDPINIAHGAVLSSKAVFIRGGSLYVHAALHPVNPVPSLVHNPVPAPIKTASVGEEEEL